MHLIFPTNTSTKCKPQNLAPPVTKTFKNSDRANPKKKGTVTAKPSSTNEKTSSTHLVNMHCHRSIRSILPNFITEDTLSQSIFSALAGFPSIDTQTARMLKP
jgi:hypothetical protein